MKTKLIIPGKCKVQFDNQPQMVLGRVGLIDYNEGKRLDSWVYWKYITDGENELKKLNEYNQSRNGLINYYNRVMKNESINYNIGNIPYEEIRKLTLEEFLKLMGVYSIETFNYVKPCFVTTDVYFKPFEFTNILLDFNFIMYTFVM